MEDKRYTLHDSGSDGEHARRKRAEAAMIRCASGKHELTDENLAIDEKGNRRCRACAQERIDARKQEAFDNKFAAYLD